MSNQIHGIAVTDPWSFAGGVMVLAVGLFARAVPARRAMHIDPIGALRGE